MKYVVTFVLTFVKDFVALVISFVKVCYFRSIICEKRFLVFLLALLMQDLQPSNLLKNFFKVSKFVTFVISFNYALIIV